MDSGVRSDSAAGLGTFAPPWAEAFGVEAADEACPFARDEPPAGRRPDPMAGGAEEDGGWYGEKESMSMRSASCGGGVAARSNPTRLPRPEAEELAWDDPGGGGWLGRCVGRLFLGCDVGRAWRTGGVGAPGPLRRGGRDEAAMGWW